VLVVAAPPLLLEEFEEELALEEVNGAITM
jgi:hypothetical protein